MKADAKQVSGHGDDGQLVSHSHNHNILIRMKANSQRTRLPLISGLSLHRNNGAMCAGTGQVS
jgi:hypothetical protein